MTVEQRSQLERNLDRIAVTAGDKGTAAVRANGMFIDSVSAPPADDLQHPQHLS